MHCVPRQNVPCRHVVDPFVDSPLQGDATQEKFVTNCWNILHESRNERNLVMLEGAFKLQIALIVFALACKCPGLILWSRNSN